MHPTLLIGLDGATFTVLDPLLRAGQMPNLARLIAHGSRGELRSTPHPLTPPAWATLATGHWPGSHGIYDFLRVELAGDRSFFTLNDARDIRVETIWSRVSRLGGRVTVINFPLTAPAPDVQGTVVPGLMSWKHLRRNVRPVEFFDELKTLPDFDPKKLSWEFEMETAVQNTPEDELEPWVQFHLEREAQWFAIVRHAVRTRPADLTAVMFDGVDKLQHACWRFLDPAHQPQHPSSLESRLQTLCEEYFRRLDDFIGELLGMMPPEVRVVVASDHGFGPSLRIFHVNKWLEQAGYLRWPTSAPPAGAKNFHFMQPDMERTLAFAPSAATNGVHIRVQQHPGDAGVAPADYLTLRAELAARLEAVIDPFSGQKYFLDVLTREQAFSGPQMHRAPDLTLVPMDHSFVSVLDREPIFVERNPPRGTHYPLGILFAAGPGVRADHRVEEQSIVDVAATLLYCLGLPTPADYEGSVMEAVFEPGQLEAQPVRREDLAAGAAELCAVSAASVGLQADEEAEIMARLRELGYVE
jgi:predicted AlkP superfamily phosphohydrolase/phosphomutase